MTEAQLEKLAAEGSIPPRSVAHWRAPQPDEVSPHSRPDEVVSFRIFYARVSGTLPTPSCYACWRSGESDCIILTPPECCTSRVS